MQGLSPTQLAARLGVSENTVRRWENGTVAPSDEKKLALSDLFKISVPYLMGWANGDGSAVDGDDSDAQGEAA